MLITEFLEARLGEDEALARAAFSGQADPENGWGEEGRAVTPHVGIIHEDIQRAHVVKWNPARVLAECAAKRAIIKLAQKATEDEKAFDDYEWQGTVERSEPWTGDAILYALAAVYADHPDYLPEWKP